MMSEHFPQDLIELQRARNRVYAELAQRPRDATAVRRRLLWLEARVFWHPRFDAAAGGDPVTRAELRRRARESADRGGVAG
ncbi:hypothetical protein [Streptomyces sp. NPDC048172]|uniref:hypothetical protein n=1 Tax=Streptomyces sp. NPDC048172 TaxID=3365505 RepID=UPI00371F0A01